MRRASIVVGIVAVLVTVGAPARAQLVDEGTPTVPVDSPLTVPTLPVGPVVSTVSTSLPEGAPIAPGNADATSPGMPAAPPSEPAATSGPAPVGGQPAPAPQPSAQPGGSPADRRPGAAARTPSARPATQTPAPGRGPLQPRLLSAARTTAAEFSATGVLAAMVGLILLGHGAARRKSAALDDSPIDDRDGVVRFG